MTKKKHRHTIRPGFPGTVPKLWVLRKSVPLSRKIHCLDAKCSSFLPSHKNTTLLNMCTKILTPHSGSRRAIDRSYRAGIAEGEEDVFVIIEHGPRPRRVRNGYKREISKWTECIIHVVFSLLFIFMSLHVVTSCCTYLLHGVLLEKLTGFQLVKKFPAFYGTRRFINAFTSARHLSQTWASSIQSIPPHPTSWRSTLILSSHLRLGLQSGLFPSGFPNKTLYTPHTRYMPRPSN